MKFTSQAANEFFKSDLMLSSDQEMIEYSAGEVFKEFYGKTLAAAVLMAIGDMKSKHEASLANGPLTAKDGTTIYALSFPNEGHGLVVARPNAERELIVWGKDKKSDGEMTITNVYLIPLLPEMPRELSEQIEMLLDNERGTLKAFSEIASEAANYAQLTKGDRDMPSILSDIVTRLEKEGVSDACWRISAGSVKIIDGRFGPSARGLTRDYSRRLDLVEWLVGTFEHTGDVGFDLREHAALVGKGASADMFGSVAANQFERAIVGHLDDLVEIADAARELRLGEGTVLAYNDTDIRVSVEDFEGKIVYRHDNIDRNEQNVFVTVINMDGDQPQSIDVYIANSWSHDFATANGLDDDQPLDRENFLWLVDDIRSKAGKLNEDVLVSRLENEKVAEGLVYSYDLAARTLEVLPLAAQTGYLSYAPHMIEGDLEVLNAVRSGEKTGLGTEFQVRDIEQGKDSDVDHIKPKKYLANLKPESQDAPSI